MTTREILEREFERAKTGRVEASSLDAEQLACLTLIADRAETQKAVLAGTMTSLVKKIETPTQDVRLHKTEMTGGYSGRSYDTNFVTPFMREKFSRLSMKSGSGWLTRSLEQNHPFTLDFPGKIQNIPVKTAFLKILDDLETGHLQAAEALRVILARLLQTANVSVVAVVPFGKQGSLRISEVIALLKKHFFMIMASPEHRDCPFWRFTRSMSC